MAARIIMSLGKILHVAKEVWRELKDTFDRAVDDGDESR